MKTMIATLSLAMFAFAVFAAGNFVQDNGTVAYLNSSTAITAGNLVDLGDRYGVALSDIASNATGTVATKGVFSIARADTNAIAAGAAVYYNSVSNVDGTATADEYVGLCAEAVAVCTALTNSAGELNKFVKVDLNAPQRQVIVGTDVQAYDADLTKLARNDLGSGTNLPAASVGAVSAAAAYTNTIGSNVFIMYPFGGGYIIKTITP